MEIEKIMNELKVDSIGRLRHKNKVLDKIHRAHLKEVDSKLMDVRIFIAKLSTGYSQKELLEMIDRFIYKQQIS